MRKQLTRIREKGYNDQTLLDFISLYRKIKREDLETGAFLVHPPAMGLASIESTQRTKKGAALLQEAQDMLYVALYGDETINVHVTRGKEEVLTMMLPEGKSEALFFLKAVTEVNAFGTWKDPEGVSNDDHTSNIGLQGEFGDTEKGTVGMAVFVALNLINLLHVNEQILYARTENVERSSLQLL
jgi:hypothetical protein